MCRILRVWKAPGSSKCRILRVWKLKTSINISHLLDFRPQEVPTLTTLRDRVGPLKQTKHPRIGGFTCLEGSGRLNGPRLGWAGLAGWLAGWSGRLSCTCFCVMEALGGPFVCILCVLEALGGAGRLREVQLAVFYECGSGKLNVSYYTCLEGSGRLNVSYFTCLEAQNVDKYFTFARF